MPTVEKVTEKTPMSYLWPAYLCVVVDFMGLALTIPVQPFLADTLGASAFQISALVGTFSAGQLLGNIVMGRLSDKIGRKPIILLSLAASTVSYVICGLAESLFVLYLARGLCGICGGTMPVAQAMVLDVVKDFKQMPKYLALVGASLGVGFTIGPAIGAATVEAWGVSEAFYVCAALSGCVFLVALGTIVETNPAVLARKGLPAIGRTGHGGPPPAGGKPGGKPGPQAAPAAPGFGPVIWACAASMFLNSVCFSTMNGLAALTLNIQFGWAATQTGIFLTVIGVFQVVMNAVIAPRVINAVGASHANKLGSVMQAGGILYATVGTLGPHLLLWWSLVWGWAFMQPSLSTAVGAVCSVQRRGAAMGVLMGSMACGRTIAPFIAGALFEANFLLSPNYELSEVDGLFARRDRDPLCVGAVAAAGGCTPPKYSSEFITTYSLSPYLLGSVCATAAVAVAFLFIPAELKPPAPWKSPATGAGGGVGQGGTVGDVGNLTVPDVEHGRGGKDHEVVMP